MEANGTILQLYKVLNLLEQFCERKNQSINISKLAVAMNLSLKEVDSLMRLVFRFQSIFKNFSQDQTLCKIWKEGKCYITLSNKNINSFNGEIRMTKKNLQILGDIIYYFCYINIGQGFSIKFTSTDLIKKVKTLKKNHPYFFEYRGDGLVYPSKLAIKLGRLLETYNRTNRSISTISCDNYIINVI
jgi:hypothetical protein